MDTFGSKCVQWSREIRNKRFIPVATFLTKIKISANIMTSISLIFGLLAVFFLFDRIWLFVLFGTLHLIADGFDGVIASLSKETKLGKYLDYSTDRLVELLIILKIGFVFQDYYAYVVAIIFLLAQLVHIASNFKSPILFTRMLIMGIVALNLPVIAYLTTGVANAYSLAKQLQWWFEGRQ
jgi:hypothetical protein